MRPLPFSAGSLYTLMFWGVFTLWILLEIIASRVKRSADSSRARDRSSLLLIIVFWWVGIAADFAFSFLLPQAAIQQRRLLAFLAGVALMLA